jgi:hypothetical protein
VSCTVPPLIWRYCNMFFTESAARGLIDVIDVIGPDHAWMMETSRSSCLTLPARRGVRATIMDHGARRAAWLQLLRARGRPRAGAAGCHACLPAGSLSAQVVAEAQ